MSCRVLLGALSLLVLFGCGPHGPARPEARVMVAAFNIAEKVRAAPQPISSLALIAPEGAEVIASDELAGAIYLGLSGGMTHDLTAQAPGFNDLPFAIIVPALNGHYSDPYAVKMALVVWMTPR